MKSLRILYIDNNKRRRWSRTELLKPFGYPIIATCVDSAALALKYLKVNLILVSAPVEDPTLQQILEAADGEAILSVIDSPTNDELLNLVAEKLRFYERRFLHRLSEVAASPAAEFSGRFGPAQHAAVDNDDR